MQEGTFVMVLISGEAWPAVFTGGVVQLAVYIAVDSGGGVLCTWRWSVGSALGDARGRGRGSVVGSTPIAIEPGVAIVVVFVLALALEWGRPAREALPGPGV